MSNISESSPKMNPKVIKDQTMSIDQDEDLVIDEIGQSSQDEITSSSMEESDKVVHADVSQSTASSSPRTRTTSPSSEASRSEKATPQLQLQPGDLAWARLGSAPFWPCVVTGNNVDSKMGNNEKEYLVQVRSHVGMSSWWLVFCGRHRHMYSLNKISIVLHC